MTVTQYIGARYVPVFADPAEWTDQRNYEPLTIVLHEGNSYTSKQYVPVGIDISNESFWAETGNYNAQVEAYRQEVQFVESAYNDLSENLASIDEKIGDGFTDKTISYSVNQNMLNSLEASNQIFSQLVSVFSINESYLDTDFIGYTPQAMYVMPDNKVVAFVAQLESVADMGVDILIINPNTSRIIARYQNMNLKHCNAACFNAQNGFVYVADRGFIFKLSADNFEIIQSNYFGANSISYDKITGKMYAVVSGNVCEYDTATDTIGNPLFQVDYSLVMQNTFTEIAAGSAIQNLAVYNNEFYYLVSGAERSTSILKYNSDYEFVKLMPISQDMGIYKLWEAQSIDFAASGTMLLYSRLIVKNVHSYAGISIINVTGKSAYNEMLSPRTSIIYCGVYNEQDNYIGVAGFNKSRPLRTFEEAYAMACEFGASEVQIISDVKIHPETNYLSKPIQINILADASLDFGSHGSYLDVYAPILFRGAGTIKGNRASGFARFWLPSAFSGIKFDVTGTYVYTNNHVSSVWGCQSQNENVNINNSYRGFALISGASNVVNANIHANPWA